MSRDGSREQFVKTQAPRLGSRGQKSRLEPHLTDVIVLVMSHYTAAQIGEWLRDAKGVKIGRKAVWLFVRRIKAALANLDGPPSSPSEAVLAGLIRKAMGVSEIGTPVVLVESKKTQAPRPSPAREMSSKTQRKGNLPSPSDSPPEEDLPNTAAETAAVEQPTKTVIEMAQESAKQVVPEPNPGLARLLKQPKGTNKES